MKLEPKNSWRDVKYLAQCYPEKTGAELITIAEHEKKCYDLWIVQQDQNKHDFAKKVNDSGAIYYKGRFGLDQRFVYKLSNVEVDNSILYGTVEKIVVFLGSERGVVKKGEFQMEKRVDEWTKLENFGFDMYEEITQKEFDKIDNYLQSVEQFWSNDEHNY